MTEDNNILEQIDNYLDGLMTKEERLAFEERIQTDADLATQVEEVRLTNEAIYLASLATLKEQVGKDIKQIEYTPDSGYGKYILGASALFIGVVGITLLSHKEENTSSTETTTPKNIIVLSEASEKPTFTTVSSEPKKETTSEPASTHKVVITPKNQSTESTSITHQETVVSTEVVTTPKSIETTTTTSTETQTVTDISDKGNEPISTPKPTCEKTFSIKTEASCGATPSGKISLTDKKQTPQRVTLDGISSNTSGQFYDLEAGTHQLQISYSATCNFSEVVTISEKWCPLNSSFSFNPDYSEVWEMKYEDGAEGTLIIVNKLGKEVYTDNFGSGTTSWNGTDNQGIAVSTGTYLALITYTDGRKEKVELTIVR